MFGTAPFGAILFDLDGVLIDSEPVWWAVINEVAHARSLIPDDGHIVRRSGVRVRDTVAGLVRGDDRLVDLMTDEIFVIGEARLSNIALTDGAPQVIKEISRSGIVLGLVSSSNTVFLERILKVNAVRRYFSVIVGGDRVEQGKPAPDGYLLAAREAGVPAGACCAVEDSPNGILAASAAGMHVVHFGKLRISDPDVIRHVYANADTFADLTKIIFKS